MSTYDFTGVAHGTGPVRPLAGDQNGTVQLLTQTQHPPWLAFKTIWFSAPDYQGPFLIRAKRLDGSGPIGLDEDPSTTALLVPTGPTLNGTDGYREEPGATWVRTPGCYGWQVDGLTFSEVIIIQAVLP